RRRRRPLGGVEARRDRAAEPPQPPRGQRAEAMDEDPVGVRLVEQALDRAPDPGRRFRHRAASPSSVRRIGTATRAAVEPSWTYAWWWSAGIALTSTTVPAWCGLAATTSTPARRRPSALAAA